jgi:hypothetical protein
MPRPSISGADCQRAGIPKWQERAQILRRVPFRNNVIFAAPDYNAGGKPPNLASLAFAGTGGL